MNKYSASVATAALGLMSISYGQTLGKGTFTSSMLTSALSHFHGVKSPQVAPATTVAVATKVDSSAAPATLSPYVAKSDTDLSDQQKPAPKMKIKWVSEAYFDAGYEKLLGDFSTQILRYGIRYGQDDLHVYFRNETLDTRGTGLPYPQAVTGTSAGIEARHWLPGNNMYISASLGDGLGGTNQGKTDARYGTAGYWSWRSKKWFSDFYGELFYIALADDTFLDWRLRSGQILKTYKDNSYLWDYVVGQFWVAGQTTAGTENRAEFGPGIGYMFRGAVSVNLEMRAGYAFRDGADGSGHRTYWNPTLIIAGGWYKGWP